MLSLAVLCLFGSVVPVQAKRVWIEPFAAVGEKLGYKIDVSRASIRKVRLVGRGRAKQRTARRRLGARPRLVVGYREGGSLRGAHLPIGPESDPVSNRCSRFASPVGRDDSAGTAAAPFRSAQRLVDSLRAGDVGCLDAGVYEQTKLKLSHTGTASKRVVLRSTPGQRALVKGQIWVADGANFVTVAHLDHDATFHRERPIPSPVVNGDDSLFYDLDVSSDNGVCFYIGDLEWGVAERTVLRRNRIHDCGQPGTNLRHGVYLAQGVDTLIEDNWIYDNPDRGIQLYPNSRRTIIRGNVIDGNGEGIIFSGDYGFASSGNLVEGNYITNSRLRHDVESWYPDGNPVGTGNIVRGNCIWGGRFGAIEAPQRGFRAVGNVVADPGYAGRAGLNFRLRAGSPCASARLKARGAVRRVRRTAAG